MFYNYVRGLRRRCVLVCSVPLLYRIVAGKKTIATCALKSYTIITCTLYIGFPSYACIVLNEQTEETIS